MSTTESKLTYKKPIRLFNNFSFLLIHQQTGRPLKIHISVFIDEYVNYKG